MFDELARQVIAEGLGAQVDREAFLHAMTGLLQEQFEGNLYRDKLLEFYLPQVRALAGYATFTFNTKQELVIRREGLPQDAINLLILLERGGRNFGHLYRLAEVALASA